MTGDSIPNIGIEQIDAVLDYLPLFEQEGYQFGHWETPDGHMPFFLYSRAANDFVRTLYEQGIIVQFDWPSWSEEAKRFQSDPTALAAADLLTVRKLLTAHVRADRFVEGHMASVFEKGHLSAILWRLRQIRDEMASGA